MRKPPTLRIGCVLKPGIGRNCSWNARAGKSFAKMPTNLKNMTCFFRMGILTRLEALTITGRYSSVTHSYISGGSNNLANMVTIPEAKNPGSNKEYKLQTMAPKVVKYSCG